MTLDSEQQRHNILACIRLAAPQITAPLDGNALSGFAGLVALKQAVEAAEIAPADDTPNAPEDG